MNVSEKFCPVCKNKNEFAAVVCAYCGAALGDPLLDTWTQVKMTDMPGHLPDRIADWPVEEEAVPESGIAVYVEGGFDPTYVDSRGEFVIGRKVGTTSEALLDLSPLGGYHRGVSRRHAVIRRTDHGYEVLDLGSLNGTWLNDDRLVPHKSYPLASGSHLRLGRMRLFVLYRPFAEIK